MCSRNKYRNKSKIHQQTVETSNEFSSLMLYIITWLMGLTFAHTVDVLQK